MNFSKLQPWLLAIRPKTLPAAVAPVIIGTILAYNENDINWFLAFLILLGAVLIQIGTNLANDYFDFKKGADQDRIGPLRVTQAGLIKPEEMKRGIVAVFALAVLVSIGLIFRGGWPIAFIGVLAILSGIFYTAGPRPLGYLGLGEIFVFIFFGPVAVGGTYYLLTLEYYSLIFVAGIAPGLLSVAVLAVNNLRDIDSDKKVGKKTLAVRFGRSFAKLEYLFCIIVAALIPFVLCLGMFSHGPSLLASLIGVLAIPIIKIVFTKSDGPSLNHALAYTGKLLLIYSILFSVGWLL